MLIGNREFDLDNEAYIMGILNVTPDSFSDGNTHNTLDKAINHAKLMVEQGADIIDVGGESTRPGYTKISDEEEIDRVYNVIKEIKKQLNVPVSIDTYKKNVALAAIEAGVDMINDIWGLQTEGMAELVANSGLPVCIMHNSANGEIDFKDNGIDPMDIVIQDIKKSIEIAKRVGVADDKIVLDPGVGFAKSYEVNLYVINHLDRLKELGYPVLLGTSRKSVVGLTLNLPSNEREEGTIPTSVVGMLKGASIYRVHNVLMNKRAIDMTKAIIKR